jgi:hypothetical protein
VKSTGWTRSRLKPTGTPFELDRRRCRRDRVARLERVDLSHEGSPRSSRRARPRAASPELDRLARLPQLFGKFAGRGLMRHAFPTGTVRHGSVSVVESSPSGRIERETRRFEPVFQAARRNGRSHSENAGRRRRKLATVWQRNGDHASDRVEAADHRNALTRRNGRGRAQQTTPTTFATQKPGSSPLTLTSHRIRVL